MNLYWHLNVPILEDNIHAEYTCFHFQFGMKCAYISDMYVNFFAAILATALLCLVHGVTIYLIKKHVYASIDLIINVLGISPV